MKRIIRVIPFLVVVFLLSSCSQFLAMSRVSVNLPFISKSGEPVFRAGREAGGEEPVSYSFKITLTDSEGNKRVKNGISGETIEFEDVPLGSASLNALLYNDSEVLCFTGSQSLNVSEGENQAIINLAYTKVILKGEDGTVLKEIPVVNLTRASFSSKDAWCPDGKNFAYWYIEETEEKVKISDAESLAAFEKKIAGDIVLKGKYVTDGTVINFWHLDTTDDQQAAWRQIADNFERDNPGVTVNITCLENVAFKQKIANLAYQGQLPDVFRSWGGGVMLDMADAGLLKDITSSVKKGYISKIGKGAMGIYGSGDTLYGAPYSMGVIGLWYNKAVFADCGLTEADFSTWDNFLASCAVLKDKGYAPVALGGAEAWTGQYWWTYLAQRLGGEQGFLDAYNGTNGGAFNAGPFLEAMNMLEKFVATEPFQDGFQNASQTEQEALVADGYAAMTLMGQWAPSTGHGEATTEAGQNAEFGLMMFPSVADGKDLQKNAQGGGDGYVISKDAPEEAVDFLKSLYEPENYKIIVEELNACPVIPGYENLLDDNMTEVVEAVRNAEYYQLYYDQFLPAEVGSGAMCEAVEAVIKVEATAQDACDYIQEAWVKYNK